MAIDYLRLLRELLEERETWVRKRDEAERELSRLSELIRSIARMLSDEQRLRCNYDELLERIDDRPRGLTFRIRGAFLAGKEWLTPVEIRDHLKSNGFNFERYKANPLASIHATLKRMVPHEVECKAAEGRKLYRLKTAGQWASSLAEARQWMDGFAAGPLGKKAMVVAALPGVVLPVGTCGHKKQRREQKGKIGHSGPKGFSRG